MPPRRAQIPTPGSQPGDAGHYLSCPYHKRDRTRHPDCARLRLRRTRDVKDHLLKRHRCPLYCPTCGRTGFTNVVARDGHVQAGQCNAPPDGFTPPPGLDLDQVAQLERRADRTLGRTEQWMHIWDVLFPGSDHPDSPFIGDFNEEAVGMVRECWNAWGQDIFGRCFALLLAHLPHCRQEFHQATCNLVTELLSASARGPPAPTALTPIPGPGQLQASATGNAQVAEEAPPQDHDGLNLDDWTQYYGVVNYGADDAAFSDWIAPFFPNHG